MPTLRRKFNVTCSFTFSWDPAIFSFV